MPEQPVKETKAVVIAYSEKRNDNLTRSVKKFGIAVVLSPPNKLGKLCIEVNKRATAVQKKETTQE